MDPAVKMRLAHYMLGFILLINMQLYSKEVHYVSKEIVCSKKYKKGAILRRDNLFVNDFLCIHSLIRHFEPSTLFEIGTCTGEGTQIIKNAMRMGAVYSLELPPGESSYDIHSIGEMCKLPYVQVIGNSLNTDYTAYYPIESWFIDGSHDYFHVLHETKEAIKANSKLIIWHDADIFEVFKAIKDGLDLSDDYILYRVPDTRIAFSLNKKIIKFKHFL
ncbi:MAG: class I SAM-dependent methyltransferase [Simkaniaceae bacterium]|nr:class I SAM-dependent methyltransferase [Simkaniaceae bacterium]